MIYSPEQAGPLRITEPYDPNESRLMGIIYKPNTWLSATFYGKQDCDDYDVVIPTVFTGFYHRVKNPGLAGATEPVWATTPEGLTVDGTTGLVWEAVLYNLMPVTETIASVVYNCTNGIVPTNTNNTGANITFKLPVLTTTAIIAGNFEVSVLATKNNGEVVVVNLLFKVRQ